MRWKYLLPRLLIVGLTWVFFLWVFDPLVRQGLVHTAEAVNGAQVEVAEVRTAFFPPRLEVEQVAVVNRGRPDTNRFEFDRFRLEIDGSALLHGRWVITDGSVDGLRWNTPRDSIGQLTETGDTRGSWFGEGPKFDALREQARRLGRSWWQQAGDLAAEQLDPQRLETVRLAETLKQQWQQRFDDYERRFKAIETRVRALRDVPKTQGNTLDKIGAYRQAALEVERLLAEARQIRQELAELYRGAGADVSRLDQARQRDLAALQSAAKTLFSGDKAAISEALFGTELVGHLEDATNWARWAREHATVPELPEPERSRGVDIVFAEVKPQPQFVLENLAISGVATRDGVELPYRGALRNVSSNPKLYGRASEFEMHLAGPLPVDFGMTTDWNTDPPTHVVTAAWVLPERKQFVLGDPDDIAVRISAGRTECQTKLTLHGSELSGRLTLRQRDVEIDAGASTALPVQTVAFRLDEKQIARRAIESALGGLNEVRADVELSGTLDRPQWKLHSDVGERIAEGLRQFAASEIDRQRTALVSQVTLLAQQETAELHSLLDREFRQAAQQLNLHESGVKELLPQFTSRPLEKTSLDGLKRLLRK